MFEWIKDFIKGVRYQMFPVATIQDALGIEMAMSTQMSRAVQNWMELFGQKGGVGLPAAIAGELARLATIESEITVSGSARAEYLSRQLQPVRDRLRTQTELGIAGGGLAFKPYIDGERIAVSYVPASAVYPASFDDSGHLTAAVFVECINRNGNVYRRLEYHRLEAEGCVIENRAFVTSAVLGDAVLGEPIPLARVPEWAGLEPKITIQNVDRLLLGYFKMPLANNVEPGSPLGVSGYSRAVDLIHQANEQWRRILWEYEGTELAVHADETLFRADSMGRRLLPDGHERLYRLVPGLENKMEVFSPAIRDEPLFNGFNNMLKRIEFQCGLAYGTLSDPQNVDKTAEEIRASKQRSFAQVRDIQKALQTALDDLVYAMDVWATLGGLAPAGAYQTAYSWDDSIVNDPGERKKLFWAYVQEGKFPFARYLQEFEGYGEDEAAAIVAAAAAESGTDEPLAFGAG